MWIKENLDDWNGPGPTSAKMRRFINEVHFSIEVGERSTRHCLSTLKRVIMLPRENGMKVLVQVFWKIRNLQQLQAIIICQLLMTEAILSECPLHFELDETFLDNAAMNPPYTAINGVINSEEEHESQLERSLSPIEEQQYGEDAASPTPPTQHFHWSPSPPQNTELEATWNSRPLDSPRANSQTPCPVAPNLFNDNSDGFRHSRGLY
jgi:hypothetical protein